MEAFFWSKIECYETCAVALLFIERKDGVSAERVQLFYRGVHNVFIKFSIGDNFGEDKFFVHNSPRIKNNQHCFDF